MKCFECPKIHIDDVKYDAHNRAIFFCWCEGREGKIEFSINDRNAENPDWCPMLSWNIDHVAEVSKKVSND